MLEVDEKGKLKSSITITLIETKLNSYLEDKEKADKQQRGKEIDAVVNLWADDSLNIQEMSEEEIRHIYQKALLRTLKKKREDEVVL